MCLATTVVAAQEAALEGMVANVKPSPQSHKSLHMCRCTFMQYSLLLEQRRDS